MSCTTQKQGLMAVEFCVAFDGLTPSHRHKGMVSQTLKALMEVSSIVAVVQTLMDTCESTTR